MSTGDRLEAAIHAGAAAPLTIFDLHLQIKKRMAAVMAKFDRLETKLEAITRAPDVIDGWLPPKSGGEATQFPFLIVRPSSGQDTWEGADQVGSAAIKLIIGTYSDTDDGWLDVLQLIEAIRADLDNEPTIAGSAFEHFGPLQWELPEQQPRPEWFGIVTTNWNIARPRRIEARNPSMSMED